MFHREPLHSVACSSRTIFSHQEKLLGEESAGEERRESCLSWGCPQPSQVFSAGLWQGQRRRLPTEGECGPDPDSWLSSHLAFSYTLQVGLFLPKSQSLLHWGGATVLAGATIQMQVLLGLWQAGVRGDELPQALWREEETRGSCW